jgi:integrase
MKAVDAATKAEIAMMHAVLTNKFGPLYADIWKVGVNLSLRISDLLTLKYADLKIEERSLKGFNVQRNENVR